MMRVRPLLAMLGWLAVPAQAVRAQVAGVTHLVVIAGVSGEARIGAEWHGMATALSTAATQRFGIPAARVTVLEQDSTADGARVHGRSTKATVEHVLGGLARTLTAADRLVVVIFAHGSTLSGGARVNLPGPDMAPSDFARVLAPATSATIAFVHTGSASGQFAEALAGPRRIVIAATTGLREQNETLFPGPFVRALTTDAGDADKDGRVSLLEAFTFARTEVEQTFTKGNLIASEHAQLVDGADGGNARQFVFMWRPGIAGAATSAAALEARAEVQGRIDALRARRGSMDEDAYLQALEPLIVELVQRTRALRATGPAAKP